MKFRIPGFVRAARHRVTVVPGGFRSQGILAVVLVLLAGGSGAGLAVREAKALPDDAVFRAFGTVLTEQQLSRRVVAMEFLYGLQRPADPAQLDKFDRSVAKAVATSAVVDQAARESGVVVPDNEVADQLGKLLGQNPGQDRRAFTDALGARGLSEQDVLDEIRRQQVNARLFEQVTKPVAPSTDDDAARFYDGHRDQMVSPEQRGLLNIVVSTEDKARGLADQAKSGADFGALARQDSLDGSTKDNGGALGTVRADQLDPGYASAAFSAGQGAVFGPVRTPQGWNVGRVTQIRSAVPMTLDEVRGAIKAKLDNDAKLARWNDFLAGRLKAAEVEYAPRYRPADPDEPPATDR
jgi:peptidyl-prolyl cis-trans isomerase C